MSDAWNQIPRIWQIVMIMLAVATSLAAGYAKLGDVRSLEPRIEKLEESVPKIESRQLYQLCVERELREERDAGGCTDHLRGDSEALQILEGVR